VKVVGNYLRDLAEPDYQVICVESGENVFDCVTNEQPDLIIIDICQGPICTLDVLVTLKTSETTHDIPVIILTGGGNTENKAEWLNLGATEYSVLTPFSPTVFKAKAATQLRIAKNITIK